MLTRIREQLSSETYHEFLKLLNMFSEEILDVESFVIIIKSMFQNDQDIIKWLMSTIKYMYEPPIQNLPDPPLEKPNLSRCERVEESPSYRKVTNQAVCSVKCWLLSVSNVLKACNYSGSVNHVQHEMVCVVKFSMIFTYLTRPKKVRIVIRTRLNPTNTKKHCIV